MSDTLKLGSTRSLAAAALHSYALRVRGMRLLQADRQVVFKVQERSRSPRAYTLRIYLPGGPSSLSVWSQCQWLRALLRDTDLVVPEPVANEDGNDVTTFDFEGRESFCTLTRWVDGARRFRAHGPGTSVMRQVGQIMASLHTHGQTFRPPKGFYPPSWDWNGLFSNDSPWHPQRTPKLDQSTRRLFSRIMRAARTAMDTLGRGRDIFGLIHGDLIQANYLVYRGSVRPIDFGDFGRGHFLYDMAITLLMLKPFDPAGAQRAAFLEGYRERRALSSDHERLLNTFIAMRAILLARWALGASQPNPGNLQWVRETLPWLGSFTL